MKKYLVLLVLFLSALSFLLSPKTALAESVDPFPPFSVEGNPPQDYFFGIFSLFRYFRPRALEIYENLDRSRTYIDLKICPGPDADHRDKYCNNQGDKCDGGDVDLCHDDPNNESFVRTITSKSGSCKLERHVYGSDPDNTLIEGHCEYTKRPDIVTKVKGTDFTTREKTTFTDLTTGYSDLTVPKIQCESCKYAELGNPENPITSGSQYLNTDLCESDIRRVVVLRRAKQTKNTLRETGEWPLGWVDWGYTIPSGKTLLQMNDVLPDDIASNLNGLIEGLDDFYLTAGDLEKTSDVSGEKKAICAAMKRYRSQKTPPAWLKDFDLVPLYPPSFRRGYIRPSICIWDICCPTTRCRLSELELLGTKRGLYYDTSVSQAYNAALDELFTRGESVDKNLKIFTVLLSNNPLIRYLSSAAPAATPSKITEQLNIQLKGTCLDYIPWSSWLSFGTHMDYLDSGNFLGPNKTCPDYELMPEVDKQRGGATSPSLLEAIINLIWASHPAVDDVEPDKYHLLTIPDAMGQSLAEIQQYAYDYRDTLEELDKVKDYNLNLSNVVIDSKDNLYAGKNMGPADAKRRLGIYTCDDSMFSSQLETSIESYALGTRIGCKPNSVVSKCDPAKFEGIIADSKWKLPSSQAQDIVKNSAMFIGGKLNPELEKVYSEISKKYDVPCEILAGHHFEEASQFFTEGGDPTKHSVANGRALNEIGQTLLESADLAAQEITSRSYYAQNTAGLIKEMSNFNGGGNANCQLGLPTATPYAGCPRLFEGEDDPYATHMLDSKHMNMYQIFCGDGEVCNPLVVYDKNRPGAFSAALVVHEYLSSQNP